MLHQPYGWGEMFGARDCSRFIMDIFATFGILMPRNSKLQARIGISLGTGRGNDDQRKAKVLDRAIPFATTLRLPGHIMLYLGKDKGKYYAIHNIWGIQTNRQFGPVLQKIGKVVVSDLSLGKIGTFSIITPPDHRHSSHCFRFRSSKEFPITASSHLPPAETVKLT